MIWRMEIRHLRFFLALADELHFTRAAARLGVAQPHLSQEIQRMERELGVLLVQRTRRRVELTPAGEAFRDGAARVVSGLAEAVEAAQRAARGETGQLVVGFVGSAAYDMFPQALSEFRAKRPGVHLILREQTTVEELDALRRGTIDVGLMRAWSLEEPGLELEVLRREPFVIAVATSHAVSKRRRVLLRTLSNEPWIAFEYTAGPGLNAQLVRACEGAGFQPRIAQTAGHIPTMLSLVASGLGIALLPAQVQTLRTRGVRFVRLQDPALTTAVVVGSRRAESNPAVPAFLALLRKASRGSDARGPARRRQIDRV
jgi:DNA-binding transcriptional LysR family regulator